MSSTEMDDVDASEELDGSFELATLTDELELALELELAELTDGVSDFSDSISLVASCSVES